MTSGVRLRLLAGGAVLLCMGCGLGASSGYAVNAGGGKLGSLVLVDYGFAEIPVGQGLGSVPFFRFDSADRRFDVVGRFDMRRVPRPGTYSELSGHGLKGLVLVDNHLLLSVGTYGGLQIEHSRCDLSGWVRPMLEIGQPWNIGAIRVGDTVRIIQGMYDASLRDFVHVVVQPLDTVAATGVDPHVRIKYAILVHDYDVEEPELPEEFRDFLLQGGDDRKVKR